MVYSSRWASVAALGLGAWILTACSGGSGSGSGSGRSCDWQGTSVPSGHSFPAGDGCNSCSCQDGTVACTLVECATSCDVDGSAYQSGATFPATDGCNTCTCEANGTVTCTTIACDQCAAAASAYATALDQARTCDPQQTGQCTQRISLGLQCACDTFANPANAAAIAAAQVAQQQYSDQSCAAGVVCEPCEAPTSATCSAGGRCVDSFGASCKVDGTVYPSGATGLPDPVSCNTCTCVDGQLACTKIACPKDCPTGTAFSTQCAQCGPTDACEVVEHACLPTCVGTCTSGVCLDGVCKTVCG